MEKTWKTGWLTPYMHISNWKDYPIKYLEHIADVHAPDEIGGTDEGSEGSGSGPSEAVNEPES